MKNLVKTMLMSILTVGTIMTFTACSSDDDILMEVKNNAKTSINQYAPTERTVLVYLAGKNNLSKSLQKKDRDTSATTRCWYSCVATCRERSLGWHASVTVS